LAFELKKPIQPLIYGANTEVEVRFDTTRIYPPPVPTGIFRDVAVGKNFKGPLDDTVRVFAVMSREPFYALLLNDTTSQPPLKPATSGWQNHGNNGRYLDSSPSGFWGAQVGDVDNDDYTDLIYGEAAPPYRLYAAKWNNVTNTWQKEIITSLSGQVRDIAIGDANNDGVQDILVAAGNSIYRIYRSGLVWQRESLPYNDGSRITGVAIGDFNPNYPGNEVIAVSYYPRIIAIRYIGSSPSINYVSFTPNVLHFDDVAVGDFDADSVGSEVAIINSYNFTQYGNLWICYFRGLFSYTAFLAYYNESGWGQEGEVTIGDVYDLADENQIIMVPGSATGNYNFPMVFWRQKLSADSSIYWVRFLPRTGGPTYGVAVGDINRHRQPRSKEFAVSGNTRLYEYEQRILYNNDLVARRIAFVPETVAVQESISVKLTVMNYGYQPQETIPVAYLAPGVSVFETCYARIGLGDSVIYTFRKKYYCGQTGNITFKAYTYLPREEYPSDDTVTKALLVRNRLEGVKLVGSSGDYSSLTAALNAWANSIITGHVTFLLTDMSYYSETYPLRCSLPVVYRESIWSLTIRPAGSFRPTIQGNSSMAIFDLIGIRNINLDSLVIVNTNTSGAVLRLRRSAAQNKITNCLIKGASNISTTGAVYFASADSNLIENCEITRYQSFPLYYGIYLSGQETAQNRANIIKDCQVYDFSNTGIYLKEWTQNTLITNCKIYTQTPQVSSYLYGITCYDYSVVGTKIIGNRIYNLNTAQSGAQIKGIYLWNGSTTIPILIANNFISLGQDLTNVIIYGIHEDTYLNIKIDIYYNSIYLGGEGPSYPSYGLYRNYPCIMNFKNNIIFVNRNNSFGIYGANTYGTFNSDYNNLYVLGNNSYIGFWNGSNLLTISQWRSTTSRDLNSISVNPGFIEPPDLHIDPNVPFVNKKASPIAGILTDIDGNPRDPSYPDIGADEYQPNPPQNFSLVAPDSGQVLVPIHGLLVWHRSVAAEYYEVLLDTVSPPAKVFRNWYADTTIPYQNLQPNKSYFWQVKAYNDSVPNKALVVSNIWNFTTVPLPLPPSNLVLDNVSYHEVSLSWQDNSTDELGFYILLRTDSIGNDLIVDSVDANITSYLLSGLSPNTRYWISVAAYNQYGYYNPASSNIITLAQTPGPVMLDSISYRRLKLYLTTLNNPSYTEYSIQVLYSGNIKYLHPSGTLVDTIVYQSYNNWGAQNGFWVKNLLPGTAYTFKVRARNLNLMPTEYGPDAIQATISPISLYLTESFEGAHFPPFGWEQEIIVSGGTNWSRVTGGSFPTQFPYHGSSEAQFNAYQNPGAHARLITPPIALYNTSSPVLTFYMYHNYDSDAQDSLVVEVSIDNGNSWLRKDKFLRYQSNFSDWQRHTVSLVSETSKVVLIGFHAYSAGGNNIYLDSIAVYPYSPVIVSQINRPYHYENKRVGFLPQVVVENSSSNHVTLEVVSKILTLGKGSYEGFDFLPFPPLYWVAYNNDNGSFGWQHANQSYSGQGCARSVGEGSTRRNNDWLVMPRVQINVYDTLKFYVKKQGSNACSLEIWISVTSNNINSFNTQLGAFSIIEETYTQKTVPLTNFAGQNIYIAFVNRSLGSDTLFLDEVEINYQPGIVLYGDSIVNTINGNSSLPISFSSYIPWIDGQYRFVTYLRLNNKFISWLPYQEKLFEVRPVPLVLISPNNHSYTNDTTPTFIWHSVPAAVQYQIQLAYDSMFSDLIIEELVGDTSFTVEPDLELIDSRYYWRVRVTLPEPPDPYSTGWSFILDTEAPMPPNLSWPPDSFITNNTQPRFIWCRIADALRYQLVVYDSTSNNILFTQESNDTTLTLSSYTFTEGRYYWSVKSIDSAGNISQPASPYRLYIDLTPPEIPTLISPRDGETLEGAPQILIWYAVADAAQYNIVVLEGGNVLITDTLSDTTYYSYLDAGNFQWKVRAQDIAGNWSDFSPSRSFNVLLGWTRKKDLPSLLSYKLKYVKDGGALVSTDSFIFAFRGNKSHEGYKYLVKNDSWVRLDSLYYVRSFEDPNKLTKKKIGKGAALCWNGENYLYATKGNGTKELWRYIISQDTWVLDTFVPILSGLKGGTSIVYYNQKIYLLAGSQKIGANNFFSYDPQNRTWQILPTAPFEPDGKAYKDGSALAVLEDKIYLIKGGGKANYFYVYNPATNQWQHLANESVPQVHPAYTRVRKTKIKDGGAMVRGDNRLFLIKGGKCNELWGYNPLMHRWQPLETIPRLPNNKYSVPSTGAALTYFGDRLYLLKGNNTSEFWSYIPHIKEKSPVVFRSSTKENSIDLKPQPALRVLEVNCVLGSKIIEIKYQVQANQPGKITIYNTLGQQVKSFITEETCGSYRRRFDIQGFKSGVYIVKYETKKASYEQKFVVSK
jgi:hypothetical protein